MDHLDTLYAKIESRSDRLCRLKQCPLYIPYHLHLSTHDHIKLDSGTLHVFAGPRFSGKSMFLRYLIDHSFFNSFQVNIDIQSGFPKYTQIQQALQTLAKQAEQHNTVNVVYEDKGYIPPLRPRCVHIVHFTTYPCRYPSGPGVNEHDASISDKMLGETVYLYYFHKQPHADVVVIHCFQFDNRATMVTQLSHHRILIPPTWSLEMKLGTRPVVQSLSRHY